MVLARVIGAVVATKKEDALRGMKLLLVQPLACQPGKAQAEAELKPQGNSIVAADFHGAGTGELVLVCQGSSARQAAGMNSAPVDAAIVGLVDTVELSGGSSSRK